MPEPMKHGYIVHLTLLDAERASFAHPDHEAEFVMPRENWVQQGRPGMLWVEVNGQGPAYPNPAGSRSDSTGPQP